MKKAYIIPSSLVIVATVITVSTASAFASGNRYGQSSKAERTGAASNQITQTSATLSTQDQQSLLYMIEEEKLAHDLYTAFYAKWGLAVFRNISNSEASHQKAVATLLAKYGINDPRASEQGVFTNPDLQNLYNTLLTQGLTSSDDAIAVGILVEKQDISDLNVAINTTSNATLDFVYGRLKTGSENHLRTFSRL
jgi:hypothetical protein